MANKKRSLTEEASVEQFMAEAPDPAPAPTSTTKQHKEHVMRAADMELARAKNQRKILHKRYKDEPKVPMYLSPMYRPHFGKVMTVSINGISIFFKVDGSTQMVPKTFADEITSRRMQIDAILTKQSKMSNVPNNLESAPGELKLF
jgi:hypothetical protein